MAKKGLKERMQDKQKELKERASSGNIIFLKPDTTIRVRILNMGEEEDFIKEVTQFYLGDEIKGVISPITFDQPCALFNAYKELREGDDEEKELSKKFNIRKRYLAYCVIYKDLKGKEVDENSPKFVLLSSTMYQQILEYYLDEDEWGDMSQTNMKGYDLKLKRTGSGKTDTEYTATACKNTLCPKPFNRKVYDLDKEVQKEIPSYEDTKEILDKFLGEDISEEEKPKKKKIIKKGKRGKDL